MQLTMFKSVNLALITFGGGGGGSSAGSGSGAGASAGASSAISGQPTNHQMQLLFAFGHCQTCNIRNCITIIQHFITYPFYYTEV